MPYILQYNLYHSFRWLKTFNIGTASQAKQRKASQSWSGEELVVEDAPFTFHSTEKKEHYYIVYTIYRIYILYVYMYVYIYICTYICIYIYFL